MQPRRTPLHGPSGAVWLVLGLAATLLGPTADLGRLVPGDVPLNWDMAGHLLHADEIRVALRHGDGPALTEQLRLWSVYPPLYHFGLGVWTAVLGMGSASVRVFLWLTPALAVLGCWLGLRTLRTPAADFAFLAFAALLPGLAHFASLAQAWMLDAPAAALALVSLGLLARYADRGRPRDGAAAAVVMTTTILVKYNFGLPLLVTVAVLGLSGIVRGGGRRRFAAFLLIGLGVLAVTAAFLTWKHAGWHTFFEFATNRSNTAELGAWTRAWRHAELWADLNFRWPAVPIVLGLLALVGIARRRHPFWLACAAYFAASFVAFARHSFFLDRLQLAAGLVFVVLAALGLAELLARLDAVRPGSARPLGGLAVAAAAAVTLAGAPASDRQLDLLFPPRNANLAEVSTAVRRIMADHDAAIVVGTFNNFSPPWTRILWHESRAGRPRPGLVTEFDYPLPPSRTGLDPAWDLRYARHLEERLKVIDAPVAITLEPYPDSLWRDGDFRHWNDWKRNYVTALRAHPDVHLVEEIDLPRAQMKVGVHRIGGPGVRYTEGWGTAEGWGRWCTAARAVVEIPVSPMPSVCVIRAAAWDGLPEVQRCRVLHADTLLAEFSVEPVPWRFVDYEVSIGPQGAGWIPLTLEFTSLWPAGPGDPRQLALAVQDVFVR